jgi:uncharacterized membrane protein YhaH (DUF805 family)
MFKSPFSFNGRIRRTEYGLSFIIYFIAIMILQVVMVGAVASGSELMTLVIFLFFIPVVYFMLAQGAKRCHDRGNSGWYQMIPFYALWMLFAESDHGINEYGPNPKGIGNVDFTFEETQATENIQQG